MYQSDSEIHGNLLEVVTGEVTPMIDVEHILDSAHGPGCVLFSPNGLSQRETGLKR